MEVDDPGLSSKKDEARTQEYAETTSMNGCTDNNNHGKTFLIFLCFSFMAVATAEFFFILVGLYWVPPVFDVPWYFDMLALSMSLLAILLAGYAGYRAKRIYEKLWAMLAGLSSLGALGFSIWIFWRISVVSSKFVFF